MKTLSIESFINNMPFYAVDRTDGYYLTVDKRIVLNGKYPTCSYATAVDNGFTTLDTKHYGDSIIVFDGDLCFAKFSEDWSASWIGHVFDELCQFLRIKGLSVSCDNCVLLVNGYKVGSYSTTGYKLASGENINYSFGHIYYSAIDTLVKSISTCELNTEVRGLSDFGVSKEELTNFANSL